MGAWKNVILHWNRKPFVVEVNRNVFPMPTRVIQKIKGLNPLAPEFSFKF
jgi:hypothetical protein